MCTGVMGMGGREGEKWRKMRACVCVCEEGRIGKGNTARNGREREICVCKEMCVCVYVCVIRLMVSSCAGLQSNVLWV